MRYADLIQFEPLESVIQLGWADDRRGAKQLVETYSVSDAIADQLANVVIPQLRLDHPHDHKGILVVGNYGTGKSHLMSVVSAIAEFSELGDALQHAALRQAARAIQGRFKVLRLEIGAVTGSLRDSVLRELSGALARWGTPFDFPPADRLTNNKDVLVSAMTGFLDQYPGCGVLVVVDELLEHLERRGDQELMLDLSFMRELGEVAALTPFRFVAGLQQMLFEHPKFQFAAERLHRVRERFVQVRIASQDLEYVVANRLLSKTDEQLAWISQHLRRCAPLYDDMPERIDHFARLFPIHPAYFSTSENLRVGEKRMVLKSVSQAIRELLPREVPLDGPGLVSYDHIWSEITSDPAARNLEHVREVVEKSAALEGRIKAGYSRRALQPVAERIIHALSVRRLASVDGSSPSGATAEELKNGLCLFLPTPEASADFLLGQVQVALDHILRTVSGQYLGYNATTGQYFLDLEKDIDFDALIEERARCVDARELNGYFDAVVQRLLDLPGTTYVQSHRIWQYEVIWSGHGVTRPGYLCFGEPGTRSTAQGDRDFYLYIRPPFRADGEGPAEDPVAGEDDVVLFVKDNHVRGELERLMRAYAGARALADSPTHRDVYLRKAEEALRPVSRWLSEHPRSHWQVAHDGAHESVAAVLRRTGASPAGLDEMVRAVGAACLRSRFEQRYPAYPVFHRLVTPVSDEARPAAAVAAIRSISGRGRSALATGVLDGLGLLDEQGAVRPDRSRYARDFLSLLERKPDGEVVNRDEIVRMEQRGASVVERDGVHGLEPEWVIVVLLSLVSIGAIVLDVNGKVRLDVTTIDRAASTPLKALTRFRHFARPLALPLDAWVVAFDGLAIPSALMRDPATRNQGLALLQQKVRFEMERVAKLDAILQQKQSLWNEPLFTDARIANDTASPAAKAAEACASREPREPALCATGLLRAVRGYGQFLEGLSRLDTEAKLSHLKFSAAEVELALQARMTADRAAALLDLVAELQPLTTYLAAAEGMLPRDADWSQSARRAKSRLLDEVRRFGKGHTPAGRTPSELEVALELKANLDKLKQAYIVEYTAQHHRLVLGPQSAARRRALAADRRVLALKALSSMSPLRESKLETWQKQVDELPACHVFRTPALAYSPTCPACRIRPADYAPTADAGQMLNQLDARLDALLRRWRQTLRANLATEPARQTIEAMTAEERCPIEDVLAQPDDATVLPDGFVDAASRALHGSEAVGVQKAALLDALASGGLPGTVDELACRFERFLADSLEGRDPATTRLILTES